MPVCSLIQRHLCAQAKPFRMVFGAIYIQQRLGVIDRETVQPITESPYLHYFIGMSGYQHLRF
jgi:hypothetical protein